MRQLATLGSLSFLSFDVGRLQVAVNDPFLMRGFQPFGYLAADVQRLINGEWSFGYALGQRFPFHQFHRQVTLAISLSTYGLCHGERNAVSTSQISRLLARVLKAAP